MADSVRIRLASATEAPTVHRVMMAAFASSRTHPHPSSALRESEDRVRQAMAEGGAVLAHLGEEVVGSGRFAWHRRHDGTRVLSYERLAVVPAHQGRGVGSAMIRWLEEHARSGGAVAVEVTVRSQQPDNRPFYQARGYRIVRYSGRYGIPDLRAHMEKDL
jgi:GNAT superfamily N-acetyltransferase